MITKAVTLNIKDLDMGKREAVLAHATYNTLDKDGDRMNRGMFDKSWKENFQMLRYFLNHDRKQAPGKPIQTWDDSEHAYTKVKHGTHTLGDDVLKMLDEGIIMAISFGFEPIKYKDIKGKGKDYKEAVHMETSVLTHWGAHDESHVVAVNKAISPSPRLNLKQLSQPEQDLLNQLIGNGMTNIMAACEAAMEMEPESDLYTYIMWYISRQADSMGDLRGQLRYGMKDSFNEHVAKMQKFIRNTTASDECIRDVQKSLNILLNKNSDTADTHVSFVKCPKCATQSVGKSDDQGRIKCAECDHVIKDGEPSASRSKDEMRRKLLMLKAKMTFND